MASRQDSSTESSSPKGTLATYLEKIQLTPEAIARLPAEERELLAKRDEAMVQVASLASLMREREKVARQIIVMLTAGTMHNFCEMAPVDGLTILELCSLLDEKGREKARAMVMQAKHEQTSAGGKQRWRNDPKTAAKKNAHNLWLERREGRHSNLRTNQQFARECMHRWKILRSEKSILNWCTQWEKEARLQPAS